MNYGKIGELKENKNNKWYTQIIMEDTQEKVYFQFADGEEKKFKKGDRVTFTLEASTNGSSGKSAHNVKLATSAKKLGSSPLKPYKADNKEKYYLPKDTSMLLSELTEYNVENAALCLQKYICKLEVDKVHKYSTVGRQLLKKLHQQQLSVLDCFQHSYCCKGTLGSRMIVGLGIESVLETSILLHHTYAFPYIPGSIVKGCLRSFIIRDLFCNDEEEANVDQDFVKAFGTHETQGKIVFLDVFPEQCNYLDIDIMNSHYSDYYDGKKAPTDTIDPRLIKFNTVPIGTKFIFRIVSRTLNPRTHEIKNISLIDLLKFTVIEVGMGAKTAVGYGWFKKIVEV
jgi:CRISPR-associated protein Cmr6